MLKKSKAKSAAAESEPEDDPFEFESGTVEHEDGDEIKKTTLVDVEVRNEEDDEGDDEDALSQPNNGCFGESVNCVGIVGLARKQVRVGNQPLICFTVDGRTVRVLGSQLKAQYLPTFANIDVCIENLKHLPPPGDEFQVLYRGMWFNEIPSEEDYDKRLKDYVEESNFESNDWLEQGLFIAQPEGDVVTRLSTRTEFEQDYLESSFREWLVTQFPVTRPKPREDSRALDVLREFKLMIPMSIVCASDNQGVVAGNHQREWTHFRLADSRHALTNFKGAKCVWTLRQFLHWATNEPAGTLNALWNALKFKRAAERKERSKPLSQTHQDAATIDNVLVALVEDRLKVEFVGPCDHLRKEPIAPGLASSLKLLAKSMPDESLTVRLLRKFPAIKKGSSFALPINGAVVREGFGGTDPGQNFEIPWLNDNAVGYIFQKLTGLPLGWMSVKENSSNPIKFQKNLFRRIDFMVSVLEPGHFTALLHFKQRETGAIRRFFMDPEKTWPTLEEHTRVKFPFGNEPQMCGWYSAAFLVWAHQKWLEDAMLCTDDYTRIIAKGPNKDEIKGILAPFADMIQKNGERYTWGEPEPARKKKSKT